MAELVFFSGTMDCGKSTLALQTAYNHEQRGLTGIVFTMNDRAGKGKLSSRLGLVADAVEVTHDMDFWRYLNDRRQQGRVDFVIVDEVGIDVYGFGITSDFLTRLFPGSQRMIELADRVEVLQVEALCWCGARATHNARTLNGLMVHQGEQVVVGDTDKNDVVAYEVLCRRHHMLAMTAASAHASELSPKTLLE